MKVLKNLEWIYEKITEYANIEMIDENSIIYGGILRDIIAKKELTGDIDMVILHRNLDTQLYKLNCDFEWRAVFKSPQTLEIEKIKYSILDQDEQLNKLIFTHNHGFVDLNANDQNSITNNNNFNICEFKNYNNRILQVMVTNDIQRLIQNVDFICCGLGMDCNGNIIEYLDGAYDDCINNRLRINTKSSKPQILINNYKQRLSKLIQRGWKPYNISKDKKVLYKKLHLQNKKNKRKEKVLNLKPNKVKPSKEIHGKIVISKKFLNDFKAKYLNNTNLFGEIKNDYLAMDTTNTHTYNTDNIHLGISTSST